MQRADNSFCETDCSFWKLQRMVVMAPQHSFQNVECGTRQLMVPEIEIKRKYYASSDCEKYVSCITRTKEKKNGTRIFSKGKNAHDNYTLYLSV